MSKVDAKALYEKVKRKHGSPSVYEEEKHCIMIFDVITNPKKGSVSAFCVEAGIGDTSFYRWLDKYDLFKECYGLAKMYSKMNWEREGMDISEAVFMPGTHSHRFEIWRMLGWSRFGEGKNARIRLNLKADSTPLEHYKQLMQQASEGEFTAGEIKQLMEAVNVGINTHQVFKMQDEIEQLKFDLTTMNENTNGNNTFADKRTS